jgi:hypothetical protein
MKLPKHKFWGAGEPNCPPELKAPNGELHTTRCKVCGDGWRKSGNVCLAAMGMATDAQREFAALSEPARLALVGASTAIMNGVHARAHIEHNPDKWLCFQFNTWDEVDAALRAVKAWDSAGYRAKDDALGVSVGGGGQGKDKP